MLHLVIRVISDFGEDNDNDDDEEEEEEEENLDLEVLLMRQLLVCWVRPGM